MTGRNPFTSQREPLLAAELAVGVANMPHAENQSSLPNICHRAKAKYW
jgi:hypothetical protein